jgi:hypothetical protein
MSPQELAARGTLLANEGQEMQPGIWESCVYFGGDGNVYHLTAQPGKRGVVVNVSGKRSAGEYLRWVDGLFRPGELPGEQSGVHYRAARQLREIL